MSEMGEFWEAYKKHMQPIKESKLNDGTQWLIDNHIQFSSHNNGIHLKVRVPGKPVVDFWPSTGKWMVEGTGRRPQGRGIRTLKEYLNGSSSPEEDQGSN